MDALDDYNIIENLSAEFLFLFRGGVMHLISKLIWSELEKLSNTWNLFGELLEFPVDLNLEVYFSSGEALEVIVEWEKGVVVLKLEKLFIIPTIDTNIVILAIVFKLLILIINKFSLRIYSLGFLVWFSILRIFNYFFYGWSGLTTRWGILWRLSLNHSESLDS